MNMKPWVCPSICFAILAGCGESTAPVADASPLLEVRVVTTGTVSSIDADGYFVSIGDPPRTIPISHTLALTDIAPGDHSIRLSGVASNCIVNSNNPQSVKIVARGQPVIVTFVVGCLENSGTLRIATITTGSEIDTDGYRAVVLADDGLFVNAKAEIQGESSHLLRAGVTKVVLQGVAFNCIVSGGHERIVNITHATLATVNFEIRCQAPGSIQFTTATSGDKADHDGYLAEMRRANAYGGSLTLPPNGVTVSDRLVPGDYTVRMWGIALNCHTPFSGAVTVSAGAPARVRIDVTCAQPLEFAYSIGSGAGAKIEMTNSRSESQTTIASGIGGESDPAWSPDGRKVAFTAVSGDNSDIYVADANGLDRIRLTAHAAREYRPAWSPDGNSIAFVSERNGNAEVYVMNSDGTNQTRITSHTDADIDPDWAPDGRRIAFARGGPSSGSGIFTMNSDGSDARRITDNPLGDAQPAWSPDGSRIAFTRATSSTRSDLYLVNADGSSLGALTDGYSRVADADWSPDGRQIAFAEEGGICDFYYTSCPSQIFVARLGDGPGGVEHVTTRWEPVYNPTWRPVR